MLNKSKAISILSSIIKLSTEDRTFNQIKYISTIEENFVHHLKDISFIDGFIIDHNFDCYNIYCKDCIISIFVSLYRDTPQLFIDLNCFGKHWKSSIPCNEIHTKDIPPLTTIKRLISEL